MDFEIPERRKTMPKLGTGIVICPWCNLECEGTDGLKAHVMGQHQDEKRQIDYEKLAELAQWHQGDIDVIDI